MFFLVLTVLFAINGTAFAADVYVADEWNYCIQKFTSDGQFVAKWGSFNRGNSQFCWPRRIAVGNGSQSTTNTTGSTTTTIKQTCEGHCGGEGEGGCWCDSLCDYYGDCCPDYDEWCGNLTTTTTIVITPHWHIETVDRVGDVGYFTSLTLDSNGNPHISYYDSTNSDLKYAYYDGSWHTETVDSSGDVGQYTSIDLDSNGNPHISYYDSTNSDLKYAYYDSSWHTETVDSSGGDVGEYTLIAYQSTSIVLDSNDNPHISYFYSYIYNDNINTDLKYAYYDISWYIETIDSNGILGAYNSIVLDSNDNPHISYWDGFPNFDLKYAYYDGSWHIETVDSDGIIGSYSSLDLDKNDNPHISYRGSGLLKYAYYDGTWHRETIDSSGFVSGYSSIDLNSEDKPHISYYDADPNFDLKYAYYDGSWHIETVDSDGDVGNYTSIALGNRDTPHISYFDNTTGDLKYAFLTCQDDFDCDGILDDDNCPLVSNPVQEDIDEDKVGDICDNCPNSPNANQEDVDGDDVGDVCDNCPSQYNPYQEDIDKDGIGNVCDDDLDGDGILNEEDNCKTVYNPGQEDSDGDGFGDVCDSENSFALIDWNTNKIVIFDYLGNLLYEREFSDIGICNFVSSSVSGWLVKGCPLSGCGSYNWIIWDLKPDLSIRRTIIDLGPGPFYTGIASGNFVSGNVWTGVIDLYNTSGAIIDSTNVWKEEDGWPYDYIYLGDIAGLANGGFVVPPEGGYSYYGKLYTPYLYFYDNGLNLVNKVDITPEEIHLFAMTGLTDGGFAATCADKGDTHDVDSLCYFNSEGELLEKIDITGDIPGPRYYQDVHVTGLQDGGVMVSKVGEDRVWIYRSPPEELDLSVYGIKEIGSITGNVFPTSYILCLITGKVIDSVSWESISGALINTNGGGLSMSNNEGEYDLYQKPGTWTIQASAAGYAHFSDPEVEVDEEDQIFAKDIIMDPIGTITTTTTATPLPKTTTTTSIKATSSSSTSSTYTTTIIPIPEITTTSSSSSTTTTIKICPFIRIYDENSEEIELLRDFRDNVLSQIPEGQAIRRLYYQWSPAIVKAMEEDEEFKEEVKEMIDGILPVIRGLAE